MFTIPGLAWGHGEDKPGPHGGHIRMPGAFHTELLVRSASEVDIFLLDVAWKNPTTQKSSVVVELKIGAETASLKCVTLEDRFRCGVNDGVVIAPGGQI
ncbi:MAG: hypothetical protein AAB425_04645, partial [Bdellovibrionota bacterium]